MYHETNSSIAVKPIYAILLFSITFAISPSCNSMDISGDATNEEHGEIYDWTDDGAFRDCNDDNPCTQDYYAPTTMECMHDKYDSDGDGYYGLLAPDSMNWCGGDDCDDNDPSIYPDADEICNDGIDQDCDGMVDGLLVMGRDILVTDSFYQAYACSIEFTGSGYAIAYNSRLVSGLDERTLVNLSPIGEFIPPEHILSPCDHIKDLVNTGDDLAMACNAGGNTVLSIIDTEDYSEQNNVVYSESNTSPSLIWTGSTYGVASSTYTIADSLYHMSLSILDESGIHVHAPILVDTDIYSVGLSQDLVWSGSYFILLWHAYIDGHRPELILSRISATGILLEDSSALTDGGCSMEPGIANASSQFGVVWSCSSDPSIYYMDLDYTGTRISTAVRLSDIVIDASSPQLEWTGSEFATTWKNGPLGEENMKMLIVEPEGTIIGNPILVAETYGYISAFDISWSGSEFGIVWTDSRNMEPACLELHASCDIDVYFNRIGFCD